MQRSVDAPNRVYLSTKQAARWLGLEPDHFEALAAKEDWLRPTYHGRRKTWHWMSIVAFAHICLCRKSEQTPAAKKPANQ